MVDSELECEVGVGEKCPSLVGWFGTAVCVSASSVGVIDMSKIGRAHV